MDWVKRNLFYAIGGAVSLILLGAAAWYYFSKASDLEAVNVAYASAVSQHDKLVADLAEYGNVDDPVAAVKAEDQRISGKIEEAKRYLNVGLVPRPKATDDQEFKKILLSTISDLQSRSTNAGISIPPDYQFSFQPQKKPLLFSTNSVDNWLVQLDDIKQLVNILIEAKVNRIEAVRRTPIPGSEDISSSSLEFLYGITPITNAFSVNQPYEIAFRGFSAELAAVLDALQRSTNFYIVKSINVEPSHDVMANFVAESQYAAATNAAATVRRPVAPVGDASKPKTAAATFESVYGRGAGTANAPTVALPPKAPRIVVPGSTNNLITVQYERPLHISLLIDLVKLKPTPGK
ncbi:MAG: hypothetical protein JWN25_3322 [Verrucomicrobiales bacterium]|nr:hypothetical protein [Verrucomicrobiales bacterium]